MGRKLPQIQDCKMSSYVITTCLLLVTQDVASSVDRCTSINQSNTCSQSCKSSSCYCGVTDGHLALTACNQTCQAARCKKLTCSSETCHQTCHNCHMECTDKVKYCQQQCLSGACSFKCNAERCVQQCSGKRCKHVTSEQDRLFSPQTYLAVLAGLFAATIIFTCLALVLSCRKAECRHKKVPGKLNYLFIGSTDSINSLSSVV